MEKGRSSERFALAYLKSLKWFITEIRSRTVFAELDIIARDEHMRTAIVEVKSVIEGQTFDMIWPKQLRRLERAAEAHPFLLNGEWVPALLYLAAVNQRGHVDLIFLDVDARSMSN